MNTLNVILLTVVCCIIVLALFYFLILKKDFKKQKQIQIVDDYIVYNKNGVSPDKINKGDIIMGKKDNAFIIADVIDNKNLELYFNNGKIKKK